MKPIKLPPERPGRTFKIEIGGSSEHCPTCGQHVPGEPIEGYVRTTEHEGNVAEVFLLLSRQGSLASGLARCLGKSISIGLRSGIPLARYLASLRFERFEPDGVAVMGERRGMASSWVDAACQALENHYLKPQEKDS